MFVNQTPCPAQWHVPGVLRRLKEDYLSTGIQDLRQYSKTVSENRNKKSTTNYIPSRDSHKFYRAMKTTNL